MVLEIELLEPLSLLPGVLPEQSKIQSFLQQIKEDLGELDVAVTLKSVDEGTRRPTLLLEGQDDTIARSFIAVHYGATRPFARAKAGEKAFALVRDPSKVGFGVFCDAGIVAPAKDALLTLRAMRSQLAGDRVVPLRPMVRVLGIVEGFPLEVEIASANVKIGKVEVRLSSTQVTEFRQWFREDVDRVLFAGATRQHFKDAVKTAGHAMDVRSIERHGLQAGVAVLKSGTDAPGIISAIGAQVPEARLGAFRPRLWAELMNQYAEKKA